MRASQIAIRAVVLSLSLSLLIAQALASAEGLPPGTKATYNIPYGPYPQTVLDLYQPADPRQILRPGAIVIHGGGWVAGSRDWMMPKICIPYLEQGFVVCNVEYRFAGVAPAPAAVSDALAAAHWFFAHARQFEVDPARIVVTGGSAGSHLAMMVGMVPASAGFGAPVKVAAIVNCYGITDVAELLRAPNFRPWAAQWVPAGPQRFELARRVSPLTYVRSGLPPVFSAQGADDPLVPVEQGIRLTDALRKAGDDAQIMIVPKAGHGFSPAQWPAVNARVFQFLRQLSILRPSGPSTPPSAPHHGG